MVFQGFPFKWTGILFTDTCKRTYETRKHQRKFLRGRAGDFFGSLRS